MHVNQSSIFEKIVLKNPIIHVLQRIISKVKIVSQLSNHFSNIILKNIPDGWKNLFVFAGVTAITFQTIIFLKKIGTYASIYYKHHLHQMQVTQQKIKQKYGDCYIAVSGFTQGIGWAFVQLLLKMNLKLILIGRNKQKIKKKINLLKQKYPKCQIEIVIGDLSKINDIQNICSQLKQLSKKIDIGIVINNAGANAPGAYVKAKPQSILDVSETNWTSLVEINRVLVPIMRKREKRSGIINISSCTGRFLSHYLTSYPSSKRMVNIYTDFLRKENQDKIDVLLAMPFGVTTNMMQMAKTSFTITPQNCAKSIIGDLLGGNLTTYGGLPHKIYGKIFESYKNQERIADNFYKYWKTFEQ